MTLVAPLSPTFDGGRRTIPSAAVTERMLELLDLTPADKVLEIGTGSGYQTQALAATGAEIHSIELEPWVDPTVVIGPCVFLHSGDGRYGLAKEAPFSAIVATCAVEEVPDPWKEQLHDAGRLVAPIGGSAVQRLTLFRREGLELIPQRIAAYVRFQMLRDKPQPAQVKPIYRERGD